MARRRCKRHLLISTDGLTWTNRPTQTGRSFQSVAYANGLWVLAGSSGSILTSPDGANWTTRGSGTSANLADVSFANGRWTVIGESGAALASSDGTNWTNHTTSPAGDFAAIAFGDSRWIAVGSQRTINASDVNGLILTSSNAVTWESLSTGNTNNIWLWGLTYASNEWITVGDRGTVLTSPDGQTWTNQSVGTTANLKNVTHGNGAWVIAGENGTLLASTNRVDWTNALSQPGDTIEGAAFGDGQWVAVGSRVWKSPDGFTWNSQNLPGLHMMSVNRAQNLWVAVGRSNGPPAWESGAILTSADGVNWTNRNAGRIGLLFDVAYGDDLWVAVGYLGTVVTSSDGVTWANHSWPMPATLFDSAIGDLYSVSHEGGLWVAVGHMAAIVTSPNGSDWTRRNPGIGTPLFAIAYGNGHWTAVGQNETILQSGTFAYLAEPRFVNQFSWSLTGPLQQLYRIQASTNLLDWTDLTSVVATNSTILLNDPTAAGYRERFYRAVSP